MSSDVLTLRELIQLANKDRLSLPLRYQWLMKHDIDPYTAIRLFRSHMRARRVLVLSLALGGALLIPGFALPAGSAGSVAFRIAALLFVVLSVAIAIYLSRPGYDIQHLRAYVRTFRVHFSELLNQFPLAGGSLAGRAVDIAPLDFENISKRAEEVLVNAAIDTVAYDEKRAGEFDPIWSSTKADLDKCFERKHAIFGSFGLTHGRGPGYFFKEAEKRLTEKKSRAQMAAN